MTRQLIERRPPASGWWHRVTTHRPDPRATAETAWRRGHLVVISSLLDAELPGGEGKVGPTYHVSISYKTRRPKPHHVRSALRDFGMAEAEEDNHHPGVARHFFLPLDPAYRGVCECKTSEVQVTEPDGYRWSQAAEGCRGCELEAQLVARGLPANPCSIHGPARAAAP